ncbi:MAG: hypothetical protein WAL37_18940 [Xanthobacteraceae bacterium]
MSAAASISDARRDLALDQLPIPLGHLWGHVRPVGRRFNPGAHVFGDGRLGWLNQRPLVMGDQKPR